MKFSILRSAILPALQRANAASGRGSTLPILNNVLLQLSDDALIVTGTDLQVEQKTTLRGIVNAEPQAGSSITVPVKKLLDVCRALPEGELHFELDGDHMHLRSGKSKYKLSTIQAADFPNIESFQSIVDAKIPVSTLNKMIDTIAFSMAVDDVRYFLNGMLFDVSTDELITVSTDGHRLSMHRQALDETIQLTTQAERSQFIVPRKAILGLQQSLGEHPQATALLSASRNMMRIEIGDHIITTKLIDATFPDYRRVLPKSTPNQFSIDRQAFRDALHRGSILSNSKNPACQLDFKGENLTINTVNELQENAIEHVDVSQLAGANIVSGFNVNYLLEALNAIKGSEVLFSGSDANSAATLTPASGEHNVLYVVMPMRI